MEAQQDKSRLKQFFRQAEISTLLKNCDLGLQQALSVFKVRSVSPLLSTTEDPACAGPGC
jgi:hypothetical protein